MGSVLIQRNIIAEIDEHLFMIFKPHRINITSPYFLCKMPDRHYKNENCSDQQSDPAAMCKFAQVGGQKGEFYNGICCDDGINKQFIVSFEVHVEVEKGCGH